MENKLMLKVACFLTVCLMRSLASGTFLLNAQLPDHGTHGPTLAHSSSRVETSADVSTTPGGSNNTSISTTPAKEKLEGSRNESVEMGANVTLHCTNSEIAWKDMIYVIWKINLQGKNCSVALSKNDPAHDTCQDGKKLIGTVDGAYNLIIPNFTIQDEGNYICDVSYQSGGYVENIYVSAWTPPDVDGWLETEQGHTVAVCTATSRPAASIYLETLDGKYFTKDTQTFKSNEGTYTVKSRFYLPHNSSNSNLTCVASHLKDKVIRYNFPDNRKPVGWLLILLGVCATCIIVTVSTSLYIMREKIKQLRVFRKICCKPDNPTPTEVKNVQPADPEDLQPYASYVQRENSIYNSSAELFNA